MYCFICHCHSEDGPFILEMPHSFLQPLMAAALEDMPPVFPKADTYSAILRFVLTPLTVQLMQLDALV